MNSISNIAVLNERANRSFSGKVPQQYLKEHNVGKERMEEQAVPSDGLLDVDKFEEFLRIRSEKLAALASAYVHDLDK